MNPFDLRGPEFLWLFAICCTAAMVVRAFARRRLGEPRGTQLDYTNAYGVAFLAGGPQAAIRAAVAALFHAGKVEIRDQTVSEITGSPTALWKPVAGHTNAAIDAFPLAVLQEIRGVPRSLTSLEWSCKQSIQTLRQSLVAAGLLPSDEPLRVLRLFDRLGWLIVAMGVIKVGVGLHRDKPVSVLVFGIIIFFIVWSLTSHYDTNTSTRAKALLRDLQWDHESLKTTAFVQPEQVAPNDVALAYGLFGVLVFGGSLTGLREVLFVGDKLWAPPPTPSGAGAGDSSCGSSSSSCGGGGSCGGGCGGCGGGGD